MPKIRVNDINLYYEIHGAGPPLLMIYGLAGRGAGFHRQLPTLAPHFRTIIFDNRGVGESDQPKETYCIAQLADDAAGLLDALQIEAAHVFGISMGGMIAQEFALRHPQHLRKLALGCTHCGVKHCMPSPPWVTELLRNAQKLTRAESVRAGIPVNFSELTRQTQPALVEAEVLRMLDNRQQPHAYFAQLSAVYQFAAHDRLPQISAPTLVLTGTEDVLVPPGNSKIIAARIPGAQLVEFADCGHLFFIEKAAAVNRILLEFFQSE